MELQKYIEDEEVLERIKQKIAQSKDKEEFEKKFQCLCEKMVETYGKLWEELFKCEDESNAIFRFAFDKIHDLLMPYLKLQCYTEDQCLFEKSQKLSKVYPLAEHFGADQSLSLPLSAAVVELSVIEGYKSPIEKMNCLRYTYDLVFAELKTALVSVISKYSEKENEIPVVNNEDIIPSMMSVIVRSKVAHFAANLFYVKTFYYKLTENRVLFNIFSAFNTAVERLKAHDENATEVNNENYFKDGMDLKDFMKLTSTDEKRISKTLMDEEKERILDLITTSTSEEINIYC